MILEKEIIGKTLSLILVSEEDETIVVTGTIQRNGKGLVFQNTNVGVVIPMSDDVFQRIKVVTGEIRPILNDADFALTLSVGNLPNGISIEGMIPTGLKWPKK